MSDFSRSQGAFPSGEEIYQIIFCVNCGEKLFVATMRNGFTIEEELLVSKRMIGIGSRATTQPEKQRPSPVPSSSHRS